MAARRLDNAARSEARHGNVTGIHRLEQWAMSPRRFGIHDELAGAGEDRHTVNPRSIRSDDRATILEAEQSAQRAEEVGPSGRGTGGRGGRAGGWASCPAAAEDAADKPLQGVLERLADQRPCADG